MNKELGFNPFLKILVKPRLAIRTLVAYNVNYRFLPLCAIYGFLFLLQTLLNYGTAFFIALILSLILSIPVGYVYFNISSLFIFWIGKLIKGKGSFKQVRAATYWTSVPSLLIYLLWITLMILNSQELFVSEGHKESMQIFTIIRGIISLILLVLSIWTFLIFLHALAEVQGFSAWLAFLNAFLGGLVLSMSIFITTFMVAWGIGAWVRLS